MGARVEKFTIFSKGFDDLIDITSKVSDIVMSFGSKEGILNICVLSSTASIITLENEPGLGFDLPKLFEDIVPVNKIYQHDNLWHDGNAFSHLRAAILGNSVTLAVIDDKIALGRWQQIVLIDFDNKPSQREIVVTLVN